jgi:uncharacterized protein
MNNQILIQSLCALVVLLSQYAVGQEVTIKDTEVKSIHSELVNGDYSINIFLPRDYLKTTKSYPVVFVLDAEYNFGMVSYSTRRLIKDHLIPEVILVGIAYDTTYQWYTNNRQRDYTPTKTQLPHTGGGKLFLDFIEKELIPFVQSQYRITDDKSVVGHSLGGLIGFYSLLTKPTLFDRYLLVSPSLWYDDKYLFTHMKNLMPDSTPKYIYASIGELETIQNGQAHDMVNDLEQFVKLLNSKTNTNYHLETEILHNETHRSVFPRAFTNGMRVLFEDYSIN